MWVKRNLVLLSLILMMIIFTLGYVSVNAGKTNWNFQIKTISGDNQVVKDIVIHGQLMESGGFTDFSMSQGIANADFTNFSNKNDYYPNPALHTGWGGRPDAYYSDTAYYSMASSAYHKGVTIMKVQYGYNPSVRYVSLNAGVPVSNVSIMYNASTCMLEDDGRFFFTVPTDEQSRGESVIYEVFRFEKKNYVAEDENDPRVKKLVSIPDDRKTFIKGLFAVNHKLCLMLAQGETIILKLFDPDTTQFMGECTFTSKSYVNDWYVNGNTLTLLFNDATIYAFEVSNGICQIGYRAQSEMSRVEEGQVQVSRRYIVFKNNIFYILQEIIKWQGENPKYYFGQNAQPERVLSLVAYDQTGTMIYHGEVESNINDDLKRFLTYNREAQDRVVSFREYAGLRLE